ncbi:GAF domain-containing sensor histidine kinase [Reinekea sp.]|jgi:signal transduction histidine kinase|uniref:sensor histidine kinase n=1 Tax=Reinekea sp. TaxID=1970455 RepID=UPI002A835CB7|nr:ATP-binding protein [Reinekea sp.]
MSNLQHLDDAFEKLANAKNLDDLIRRAVLALRDPLGFDRAGILLYDRASNEQVGTWGTDAHGQLRSEHDFRAPVGAGLIVRQQDDRVRYTDKAELQELGKTVDTGWHLQAAIFSGNELFGWIFVDNLVNHRPLAADQFDLARTYANVLGQLIVHSKIEDSLIEAIDSLASNEDLKAIALKRVTQLEGQIAGNRKMVLLAEQLAGLVPMSTRSVGNLLNFMALLSPDQFTGENQALLDSARKSADQLARIYRHFDKRVHDATDNDVQSLPASVIQDYWQRQFTGLFRNTSHHLEVRTEKPGETINLPLILLTRLVKELISNALLHGLEGCSAGRALVTLRKTAKVLVITVEDSGSGLHEEQCIDALKLFVTAKPYEYLGTGLNVVQHYVERWLNGQLDLGASPLGGLCCTLTIPIQRAVSETALVGA